MLTLIVQRALPQKSSSTIQKDGKINTQCSATERLFFYQHLLFKLNCFLESLIGKITCQVLLLAPHYTQNQNRP